MQITPQATRASSVDAADRSLSLGEILWRDTESGVEGRTVIRTSKCTIGSHPESTICLPEPTALYHATLTFGKRFTLLKAPYPTQIAGRFVREWLIDEPTELNIGTWRILVVPARCSKQLASILRPSEWSDAPPASVCSPSAAVGVTRSPTPSEPAPETLAVQQALDRVTQIEEQNESRFQSLEASIELLRGAIESVQTNVTQSSSEWLARYQAEIQRQIESLVSSINEKLDARLAQQQQQQPQEAESASPRWQDGLPYLEARLSELSDRVDRLTSSTDETYQRLNAIAANNQENHDYVLGQIHQVQSSLASDWNGAGWSNPAPVELDLHDTDASLPYVVPVSPANDSQLDSRLFGSEILDYPAAPTMGSEAPAESSFSTGPEVDESNPDLDIDNLSERLRKLIAEAGQQEASSPVEESPRFPNSALGRHEQDDAPSIDSESSHSEWRPSNSLNEEIEDLPLRSISIAGQYRMPWNSESLESESYTYEHQESPSLDADAILAKYGSGEIETSLEDLAEEPPIATTNHAPSESEDSSAPIEEESIEAYMQKLLQRVKTGVEPSPDLPVPSKQSQRSRMEILTGAARESGPVLEEQPAPTTRRMMTPAEFTPRNMAPEKKNDLDALRELANINARRAISHSDKKRNNSAILFKISIVSLAIASAAIIYALNGIRYNPHFAGMIAALVVAGLWGFDCFQHFRKLGIARSQETTSTARNVTTEATGQPSP